nr:hypothetical protein [uncultured Flavobacterium sp.]
MKYIDLSSIKHIICYGGIRGRLNWPMKVVFTNGDSKVLKRDPLGIYVVINYVRNYFPKEHNINSTNLFSEMKHLL